jgi:murein DD-endopeptidase MepM/ murein hydrolase activator NlpD
MQFRIESPVGPLPTVRNDEWGNGNFGSARGSKKHDGTDLVVTPGQPIFSMIDGTVEKYEQCYLYDTRWKGVQIANAQLRVELWYMDPSNTVAVGQFVQAGQHIGVAQDISIKYPPTEKIPHDMTPHLHVRVTLRAFTTIADGRYVSFEQYIDPLLLLRSE